MNERSKAEMRDGADDAAGGGMNWSMGYEEEETRTSRRNQPGTEKRSRMAFRSVNKN